MVPKVMMLIMLLIGLWSWGQHGVTGKWKTIDDLTGKPISIVEIFENRGKFYGKVVEIIDPKSKGKSCEQCPGTDRGKPVLGLMVIKGLVRDGDEYTDGRILDPKHGKLYKCYINLESHDRLKVRGYIGVPILGRTQYWHRVKN